MLLVLDNVTPPLVRLVAGLSNTVASLLAFPNVYITHGQDGGHKKGSLHYRYAAIDVRTKNLTPEQQTLLVSALQLRFPKPRFDVLFEDPDTDNQHIHIEDNSAKREDDE